MSLHDFVCDRVLFTLNQEFFRFCEKPSFLGKNCFFGNSLLESFGLELLVPYTFVAEHVANMLN